MQLTTYTAEDLFQWVTDSHEKFALLDVRNDEDFGRFKVEGPYLSKMDNIPYVEFVEKEEASVAKVRFGKDEKIRIVCAKEGSSRFVGEILAQNGWTDIRYLEGGIKTWGNLLTPKCISSNTGYELYQFIRPGKASCSYGLICNGEMAVFDPSRNVSFYKNFAGEKGARIVKTFETHLQADYISGSMQLSAETEALIVGHPNDFKDAAFSYHPVTDNETFQLNGSGPDIKAIHMPGHTPGSTAYLIDNKYLVSGDTVFILSIGRPDLGGKVEEWSKLLYSTIQNRLFKLNDDIRILPGHYVDWSEANPDMMFVETWGRIKGKNADIYGIDTESDFVRFIKENMRKQPDVYAEIRKVNAGLLTNSEEEQEIMDLGKNECAASRYGHG